MQEYYFKNEIFYCKNEFKPEKLTLVFVHGLSGSFSALFPYEKIFGEKYNILFYDIRGHGMSKKFLSYLDYEIKNFADDLHELVNHLKIYKFILISNSFGALIALEYLKWHRESVLANIFTSPEVYLHQGFLAKIARPTLNFFIWILYLLPFNPHPRGQVDYSSHIGSTDWDPKRIYADLKNTTLRVHLSILRQSINKGQDYQLRKITVPTLIIHGEKDTMVPITNAIMMSKKIKDSVFISIPGIDHNTVHNAVTQMSEAIESFIEKNKAYLLKSANLLE